MSDLEFSPRLRLIQSFSVLNKNKQEFSEAHTIKMCKRDSFISSHSDPRADGLERKGKIMPKMLQGDDPVEITTFSNNFSRHLTIECCIYDNLFQLD